MREAEQTASSARELGAYEGTPETTGMLRERVVGVLALDSPWALRANRMDRLSFHEIDDPIEFY